jgi:hypothetical protein
MAARQVHILWKGWCPILWYPEGASKWNASPNFFASELRLALKYILIHI